MDAVDMDLDWCLACSKRTKRGKPYCSHACRKLDINTNSFGYPASSSSSLDDIDGDGDDLPPPPAEPVHSPSRVRTRTRTPSHHSPRHSPVPAPGPLRTPKPPAPQQQRFIAEELARLAEWPGYTDAGGILAWARAIPPCAASSSSSLTDNNGAVDYDYRHSTMMTTTPTPRPDFPLSRQRPALPALCMNTSQPARTGPSASTSTSTGVTTTPISMHPSPVEQEKLRERASASSLVSALAESFASSDRHAAAAAAHNHNGAQTTQVLRGPGAPPRGVFDSLAARFRAVRTSSYGPPVVPAATLGRIPTLEIMKTTTTTTTSAEPSPSPSPSSPTKNNYLALTTGPNAPAFTVLGTAHTPGTDIFSIVSQDHCGSSSSFLKKGAPSRGVWIAGRKEAEEEAAEAAGYLRYGPGYYESAAHRPQRAPVRLRVVRASMTSVGGEYRTTMTTGRRVRRVRAVDSESELESEDEDEGPFVKGGKAAVAYRARGRRSTRA